MHRAGLDLRDQGAWRGDAISPNAREHHELGFPE
jgi:hypothetical protein